MGGLLDGLDVFQETVQLLLCRFFVLQNLSGESMDRQIHIWIFLL